MITSRRTNVGATREFLPKCSGIVWLLLGAAVIAVLIRNVQQIFASISPPDAKLQVLQPQRRSNVDMRFRDRVISTLSDARRVPGLRRPRPAPGKPQHEVGEDGLLPDDVDDDELRELLLEEGDRGVKPSNYVVDHDKAHVHAAPVVLPPSVRIQLAPSPLPHTLAHGGSTPEPKYKALWFTMDSLTSYIQAAERGGPAGEIIVRHSLTWALSQLGVEFEMAGSDEEFAALTSRDIDRFDLIFLDPWTTFGKGVCTVA